MDLHLIPGAEASPEERAAVDGAVDARDPEAGGGTARHLLLPALRALQARAGWISPGGLNYACSRLDVAPADAYGVATFYAMLSVSPQPRTIG